MAGETPMGRYDNPLHVRVHTVSQGREALLHVAICTRGGVGLDRCPDGGQVSRKRDGVGQCTTPAGTVPPLEQRVYRR